MSHLKKLFLTVIVAVGTFCALLVQTTPQVRQSEAEQQIQREVVERTLSFLSYGHHRATQRRLAVSLAAGSHELVQVLNGRGGTSAVEAVLEQAQRPTGTVIQASALLDVGGEVVARLDENAVFADSPSQWPELTTVLTGAPVDGSLRYHGGTITFVATAPIRNQQGQVIGALAIAELLDQQSVNSWSAEAGTDIVVFADGLPILSTVTEPAVVQAVDTILVQVAADPAEYLGSRYRPDSVQLVSAGENLVGITAVQLQDPFSPSVSSPLGVLLVHSGPAPSSAILSQVDSVANLPPKQVWLTILSALILLIAGWILGDLRPAHERRHQAPLGTAEVPAVAPPQASPEPPPEPIEDPVEEEPPANREFTDSFSGVGFHSEPTKPTAPEDESEPEEFYSKEEAEGEDEDGDEPAPSAQASSDEDGPAESEDEIDAVLNPRGRTGPFGAPPASSGKVRRAKRGKAPVSMPTMDDVLPELAAELAAAREAVEAKVAEPGAAKKPNPFTPVDNQGATRPVVHPVNEVARLFSPWDSAEKDQNSKMADRRPSQPSDAASTGEAGKLTADELAMIDDSGLYRSSMIPDALRALGPTQPGWQDAGLETRSSTQTSGTEEIRWGNMESDLELPEPLGAESGANPVASEDNPSPEEEDNTQAIGSAAWAASVGQDNQGESTAETGWSEDADPAPIAPDLSDAAGSPWDTNLSDEPAQTESLGSSAWTNSLRGEVRGNGEAERGHTQPTPASLSDSSVETDPLTKLYDQFVSTRRECGESVDSVSFAGFKRKISKTETAVKDRFECDEVRFEIYVKGGRAAIKATPVHH